MKLVRLLLTSALALSASGAADAQMPGYAGGGPYGASPVAFFQPSPTPAPPMDVTGEPPPAVTPAPGPVYTDSFLGSEGFADPDLVGESYGGAGGMRPLRMRPRLRQRTSRGYITAEALLWDRNDPTTKRITAQGTATATSPTVMNSYNPDVNYETAPRITAGYVFMNDLALEGTVFYKDDYDAVYDVYGAGNLNALWFGLQPGFSNWTDANQQSLRIATGLHNYEVNLVETSRVFNFLTGFRYMEVRDRATFTTLDGAAFDSAYIGTYNRLLGMQTGVRTRADWWLLGMELQAKVGYFINEASSRVSITDSGNTATPTRNSPVFSGTNDALISDMRIMFNFRPASFVNLRAGYECLFIVNTALAIDQINDNPLATTNLTGTFFNAKGDLFFHGPVAGAEFRW